MSSSDPRTLHPCLSCGSLVPKSELLFLCEDCGVPICRVCHEAGFTSCFWCDYENERGLYFDLKRERERKE